MAYPRSFLGLLLTGFTVVALPLVGALAYSAWNTERLAEQSRTAVFSASQAARASRSLVNRIGSIERLAQQLAAVKDPALAADYAAVHRSFRQSPDEVLILLVIFSTAVALTIALGLTRYISRPIAALDASIRQLGGADFSREITVRGPEDLQSLGERLDWLRRRLAELEAEKNRFLRHLSHELKTPLTVLREGAELLNDQVGGPLALPQRQVVAIMRDNSVKLQRLIEDLLDYQRALHSAGSLQPRAVALDALVQDVARPHQLAVQAKGQRLELDLDKVSVEADPEKLRSIIDNLLGNAVKFTPSGGTIRVLTRAADREAMVDVIDTGPGVPLEERESIFDSFFRGRAKESGRIEGTGLGLAIAREFVEAHGGRISVVSEASGGHFRVTLPRKPARALPVAA